MILLLIHRAGTVALALMAAITVLPPATGARGAPPRGYTWRLAVNIHPAPLFYHAAGIAIGGAGNIFVADDGDHQVVKLSPAGAVLATWGTDGPGPLHFDGPRAVAVDANGNVYVADNGVIKLSSSGRFVARRASGFLAYPRSLAVDRQNDLYVLALHPVSQTNLFDRITITRLAPGGKKLGAFVYTYPQPIVDADLAAAIATTPDGHIVLSLQAQRHCHDCNGTYYLLRTISPAGETLSNVSENAGGGSIAADSAGDMYLTQPNAIEKLSSVGALVSTFGTAGCGAGQLGADLRVATSPLGSLYVADSQIVATRPDGIPSTLRDGVLHRFAFDGTPQALAGTCPVAGAQTQFGQINDLAVGGGSALYVADVVTSKVYRIGAGGTITASFGADHPSTVTTDSHGNVYVPDLGHDSLVKLSPDGRVLGQTRGWTIEAAAIARSGRVYALTAFGQVLVLPPVGHGSRPMRRWWLNGYQSGSAGLDPEGIALDGQGHIWVADIRHNNIQEYSPSGRLLLIRGRRGTGPYRFHNPNGLTVDGHRHLFVLDGGNDRVQEFDLRGHYLATFGRDGQAPGQFDGAWGIGADAKGDIYVGDRGNDRIQELVRG